MTKDAFTPAKTGALSFLGVMVFLDSRLRGNDGKDIPPWLPAFAGITGKTFHEVVLIESF